MERIGLIDVDGHNFPNLALMKISAFHKSIGDRVEWAGIGCYDRTYVSKVFTFSQDVTPTFGTLGDIHKGGTGYGLMEALPVEIDGMCPDYSIYPAVTEAYGFLTRGCPNKCKWCIVPEKEGQIRAYADIENFLDGRKVAVLMDNNVLAHPHGLEQIEKIVRLRVRVDFNQGLDARIIAKNEGIAELLGRVRWYKPLRMACDSESQMPYIEKAASLLRKHGAKPARYSVYCLLTDLRGSYDRINFLRDLNIDPFAQPYIDFTGRVSVPQWQKDMANYVNKKSIFKTVKDFKDFRPRRNFKCSEYFNQKEKNHE
jgi:hypothetical protein